MTHSTDLHPIGCLFHLLSEGLGLGARLQSAGMTGGLGCLLISTVCGGKRNRQLHVSCFLHKHLIKALFWALILKNTWTRPCPHLVRAESMSKTSLAKCFLCFWMLGMSTYRRTIVESIHQNETLKKSVVLYKILEKFWSSVHLTFVPLT